jgi:LPS export ABC transporter permease LptG
MKLLDRYVLRNFLEPFAICFIGFIAIWLIFDLSDNGPDFIEAKTSPKQIARFYLTQLPQTILISLPVGLLLALLFSLSRMSRSNEIISMLTAGRSVTRLLVPLIVVGLIASAACILLNYELAPKAEAGKRAALEQITRGGKKSGKRGSVAGHLFVDRQNHRVWYVRKMRSDSPVLEGVHVSQRDPSGGIVRKWYAKRATYNGRDGTWEFARGRAVDFDAEGDILRTDDFSSQFRVVSGWSETPWRIASSQLEAQNLSIPDLRDYLKHNLDFPEAQLAPYRTYLQHRWALPWSCLVVVFIAAPLGIVYSRRAVLAGVASSIFIFFGMIFLTNFFLAMGKGARVDPFVAAWLPNLFFFTLGVVLLYFRSTNRDYPKLFVRRR